MSAGQLRGVIFDMDGVLVDSHAVHRKAWREFFQGLGHEVPEFELDFILDGRKRSDILRHFLGSCPDAELEELGRRKDRIFREMRLDVAPVPGAVVMVHELHRNGTTLAMATSASRSRALGTLTELDLLHCFQAIVTGEDVVLGKPDSAIYREACSRIEIEPRCLLAVEDAISGVRAAVAAGLQCVGVALHESKEKLTAAGAIHVIRDFESVSAHDLEDILAGCESRRLGAAAGSS
ncbi:MAG: Beta-phosphoglucomutase [Candidatus Sulfotelmatobacter sp.]|nr:Beta-phosphoglucomutase [Candidatus Sulfotelmatobacter sp.]